MRSTGSHGGRRGTPGPLIPALAGAVVGVLVLSLFAFPPVVGHRGSAVTTAPTRAPALVDPQFLPTILTSSNITSDGLFGDAVAASGSTYAVGAPHELLSEYLHPTRYGEVHLYDTANGARAVIGGPTSASSQFGSALAMSSTQLVVGAYGFGDSEGAAYVYDYTLSGPKGDRVLNVTEVASFLSPNPQTADGGGEFGFSVAISGDLVAIGAPFEEVSGYTQAGHVYVFNLATGSSMMVSSPAPESYGAFGFSVAISGSRLLVGADGASNATGAVVGRAYVFAASSGDLLTTLVSPLPSEYDYFGHSVALSGTLAVVGADETGGGGPYFESGAAFEFNLATNATLTLRSPSPQTTGYFGISVAVDSNTIVVGASGEASDGSDFAGNAYLFSASSGDLISSTFQAPDWPSGGDFGSSVAENGTDGVIVGAPYANIGTTTYAGHAYIFHQIPLTLASPNPLLPSGTAAGGLFGWSVAVDNGVTVVGAPNETGPLGELTMGHAYLLTSSTGPVTLLSPTYNFAGDLFGASVAIWGKLVVVGAPGQTAGGGAHDGAVYLFSATTGALQSMLVSPHPAPSGQFGFSVATNGSSVVVGAPGENGGAGYAYVFNVAYHCISGFCTPYWTTVLLNTSHPCRHEATGDGEFGFSVAINASTVVVGAPGENGSTHGVAGAGNVYVFDGGNGTRTLNLTTPNPQVGLAPNVQLGFGRSVAVATGTIVVGSPGETALGLVGAGHAYVFSETSGLRLHTLTSPNPSLSGTSFGWAVAVNAGVIGVTAVFEPAFGVGEAGNLYLFNPGTGTDFERYNSPVPAQFSIFGNSVSIGHGGTIVVGQPGVPNSRALSYGSNAGLAYQFFF